MRTLLNLAMTGKGLRGLMNGLASMEYHIEHIGDDLKMETTDCAIEQEADTSGVVVTLRLRPKAPPAPTPVEVKDDAEADQVAAAAAF